MTLLRAPNNIAIVVHFILSSNSLDSLLKSADEIVNGRLRKVNSVEQLQLHDRSERDFLFIPEELSTTFPTVDNKDPLVSLNDAINIQALSRRNN